MSKSNGAASANGTAKRFASFREIADFLWQNAERMRGTHKPNEYDEPAVNCDHTRLEAQSA